MAGIAVTTRRMFVAQLAGAAAAMAVPAFAQSRRQVRVAGRPIRTVDAHAHTFVPAVADVVRAISNVPSPGRSKGRC